MQPKTDGGTLISASLAKHIVDELGPGQNVGFAPVIGSAWPQCASRQWRQKTVLSPERELIKGNDTTTVGQRHNQLSFGSASLWPEFHGTAT